MLLVVLLVMLFDLPVPQPEVQVPMTLPEVQVTLPVVHAPVTPPETRL